MPEYVSDLTRILEAYTEKKGVYIIEVIEVLYHIIEEYYDIMQHARRDEIEKLIGDYAENKGLTDPELIEALGAVADIQVDKL